MQVIHNVSTDGNRSIESCTRYKRVGYVHIICTVYDETILFTYYDLQL